MSLEVVLMVLGAALLHATWNALVKSDGDRLTVIKLMFLTELLRTLVGPYCARFRAAGNGHHLRCDNRSRVPE